MAEKRQSYTEEELNEMIAWFNDHASQLPKTMQINKSAFTPDLALTVEINVYICNITTKGVSQS